MTRQATALYAGENPIVVYRCPPADDSVEGVNIFDIERSRWEQRTRFLGIWYEGRHPPEYDGPVEQFPDTLQYAEGVYQDDDENGMSTNDQAHLAFATSQRDMSRLQSMVANAEAESVWARQRHLHLLRSLSLHMTAHRVGPAHRMQLNGGAQPVSEENSHLLLNFMNQESHYRRDTRRTLREIDGLPHHAAGYPVPRAGGYPADERDPGIDDATISVLQQRLLRVRNGFEQENALDTFFNTALRGYNNVHYGPHPSGRSQALDPVYRMVIYADDLLVLRRPSLPAHNGAFRPSNGRYEEYGRLYRRAASAWL